MPVYEAECRKCGKQFEYFRKGFKPKPVPRCECGGSSRMRFSHVSAPMDWDHYHDTGLGIEVGCMADINRRVKDLRQPQTYWDPVLNRMNEVPGVQLENAGRIHGA